MTIQAGDYYQLLKLDRNARPEAIETALWRYQSAIGNGPGSDVGTIIHAEATRVLLTETERQRYDAHLQDVAVGAAHPKEWPTPWSYAVDLSIPHNVPILHEKGCTRCAGTPARRVTIPRFSVPNLASIMDNRDRSVSYIVQHCRTCGLAAVTRRTKTEGLKVLILLALAIGLGFFVSPALGIFVAFFPAVLAFGIWTAWLRFRTLKPPSGRLPSFRSPS